MQRRLWYDKPAADWENCLPLGNGVLGAMVFGGVHQEKLQLNEESVWYGGMLERDNPDALTYLGEIRALIERRDYAGAEELAQMALSGVPDSQRGYQSLGEILLAFGTEGEYSAYTRELCLDTACVRVRFRIGESEYLREHFIGRGSNAFVTRISCVGGTVDMKCLLRRSDYMQSPANERNGRFVLYGREHYHADIKALSDDTLYLTGDGGRQGIEFAACVRVKQEGGTLQRIGDTVRVRGAKSVEIYESARTSFRCAAFSEACRGYVDAAYARGYEELFAEHKREYAELFGSTGLFLGQGRDETATDVRRREFTLENDPDFLGLYFAYARYLLIACSAPEAALPANLQGIWCGEFSPSWDSKFTININTEMNYWPVMSANLAPCHMPLIRFLERLDARGRCTARVMYGCGGAVAHHNSDIYADAAPHDVVPASTYWPFGLAWLSMDIYRHYEYTRDIDFLSRYYYIMRDAAEFLADFMQRDENGQYYTSPSTTPENVFELKDGGRYSITRGCTMDYEIIRELFRAVRRSAEALGRDAELCGRLAEIADNLPPYNVGSRGQLLEWEEELKEIDPGHRHFSHLFSLFPGSDFTPDVSGTLAQAARRSMDIRLENGGAHTGWSRAWAINLSARLKDADAAAYHLRELFHLSMTDTLLNTHPPFQIDGNFGTLSGITEMLLQSHAGIELLPALPEQVEYADINSLMARGGLEVSMRVRQGKLSGVSLRAHAPGVFTLRYRGHSKTVAMRRGEERELAATELQSTEE